MSAPRVVLITAGTAGLGAAAARYFAKQAFRVVVNYNANTTRANNIIEELKSLDKLQGENNYLAIKADLAHRGEINQLVKESISVMGRLDVVFSNGGWTKFRDMTSLDDNVEEDDWDRAFNINVKSHLWLMHAVREELDKSEGAFVSTSSLAGVTANGSSLVCQLFPGSTRY